MIANKNTQIEKDPANKTIRVVREFDAPVADVWKAWTESHLLDQWWAPKPWKAQTRKMNFSNGGSWLYAMVGPDGGKQWCCVNFTAVEQGRSFSGTDAFCDENGNINPDFPVMHWQVYFEPKETLTVVRVEIRFNSEDDMNKIVEMGFEEGFTAAHGNLDELLKK